MGCTFNFAEDSTLLLRSIVSNSGPEAVTCSVSDLIAEVDKATDVRYRMKDGKPGLRYISSDNEKCCILGFPLLQQESHSLGVWILVRFAKGACGYIFVPV